MNVGVECLLDLQKNEGLKDRCQIKVVCDSNNMPTRAIST